MWKALYLRRCPNGSLDLVRQHFGVVSQGWLDKFKAAFTYRELFRHKVAPRRGSPAFEVSSVMNVSALCMSGGETWDLLLCRPLAAGERAARALSRVWLQGDDLVVANLSTPNGGRAALWRAVASACGSPTADGATDVLVKLPSREYLIIGFTCRYARDYFVDRFSALRAAQSWPRRAQYAPS